MSIIEVIFNNNNHLEKISTEKKVLSISINEEASNTSHEMYT